jgi:LuxR family maltose regulon positive regulatory protein
MNSVLALSHLGDVSVLEGHFCEGRVFYERALALAVDDQGQREPIAGIALIGLGGLEMLRYNLQDAERHLVEGINLVKRWGKAGAIGGYVALARVRRVQGDLEGAHEAIQTAERLAIQFEPMRADDAYVATEKAHLWLAQGDIESVSRWIEDYGLEREVRLDLREQDGSGTVPFNHLLVYQLAARVHLAENRPEATLQILRPLRRIAETSGWTMYTVRLLIVEALALHQQGNIPEAMNPLARALALCDPEGGEAFFLEEGAPMVELLRHAASRGIAPERASSLLARFETKLGATSPSSYPAAPPALAQPLVEPLTERELDVLRLLATRLTTAEIADRLFITVSTVRSHNKNIYAKLNVHRRWDAAERARELKLI